MLKRGDIIIAALILSLSCLGLYIKSKNDIQGVKTVEVVHDGKVVDKYVIDDKFDGVFDFYDGNGGHEVYHIHDGGVEVIESNTPHKICMKMGFIDKNNQMIVALPHKMYITIKTTNEESDYDTLVK